MSWRTIGRLKRPSGRSPAASVWMRWSRSRRTATRSWRPCLASPLLTLPGAVRDHIDGWEFEVFPQIVLAADPDELEEAARAAATARAG